LRDPDSIRFQDSDLTYAINQAYRRAYLTVLRANQGYFETVVNHNIVANTATITLPTDHYSTVSLEYVSGNLEIPLFKRNRGVDINATSGSSYSFNNRQYTFRIRGPNILIEPTPQISVTNGLKHTYIETLLEADDLTVAGSTVHAEFKDIWCDVIVLDAAVNCLSQIEVLGADVSQNIVERLNMARELMADTLSVRVLSPNKNRRLKGYFK